MVKARVLAINIYSLMDLGDKAPNSFESILVDPKRPVAHNGPEAVKQYLRPIFGENIYLHVQMDGTEGLADAIFAWMKKNKICERTGIPESHILLVPVASSMSGTAIFSRYPQVNYYIGSRFLRCRIADPHFSDMMLMRQLLPGVRFLLLNRSVPKDDSYNRLTNVVGIAHSWQDVVDSMSEHFSEKEQPPVVAQVEMAPTEVEDPAPAQHDLPALTPSIARR